MKHVCIALAVLAVTTAALPADEHTLEVDTENMLLQANARVQALLAEGKDDSACRDLAKSEKKIAKDTINTNQNMLNSIPSGKNCHYAGQVAVDAATSTKSAADNSLTLAEQALSSAQNFQIDFGKRSFNSMSGSCAIAKSDNKYVSAKENGDAAKETLLQAQGAAKIAATELRSAREAALKKKQACKCNVQKKQAAGWKEANTNNAAIATGYNDAMKMMCVLDGKKKCHFPPLQSLVRPTVHFGSKNAVCHNFKKYKFFRFNVQKNNGGFLWAIRGVKFYGVGGTSLSLDPSRASASSQYSNLYRASKAFGGPTDQYFSGHHLKTGWLQISFPTPTIVKSYSLSRAQGNKFTPKDWNFAGSNDGVTWDILDSQKNVDDWNGSNSVKDFTCEDATP